MANADGGFQRVVFNGSLTIRTIGALRDRLRSELNQNGAVAVDCTEATEIDAAFLQLLVSARRDAELKGKTLWLWRPPDGPFREALLRGGFIGTDAEGHGEEFWMTSVSGR